MMVEQQILAALQTATIAAVAASIDSTLAIKAVGRTFTPPDEKPYLEIVHIPNNIDNEFWGSEKTYRGLFRLLFHFPLLDEGAYPAMTLISSVCAPFTKEAVFTSGGVSVKVYEEPDLTGVIEAPPTMLYPVTIRYMSFQP